MQGRVQAVITKEAKRLGRNERKTKGNQVRVMGPIFLAVEEPGALCGGKVHRGKWNV